MLDDKLKNIVDKYNEINEKLMEPDVVNNQELYKNYMKDYKNLTPIVEKYNEYEKANIRTISTVEKNYYGGSYY